VVLPYTECTDGSFRCRIVDRDLTVIQKYPEVFFLVDTVIKTRSSGSFGKLAAKDIFHPRKIFLYKRLYIFLPLPEALRWCQPFQAFIRPIDCGDPYQCLICSGSFGHVRILYGLDRIREIPSCMGPAVGIDQPFEIIFNQVVLCQTVSHQNAFEIPVEFFGVSVVTRFLVFIQNYLRVTGIAEPFVTLIRQFPVTSFPKCSISFSSETLCMMDSSDKASASLNRFSWSSITSRRSERLPKHCWFTMLICSISFSMFTF